MPTRITAANQTKGNSEYDDNSRHQANIDDLQISIKLIDIATELQLHRAQFLADGD